MPKFTPQNHTKLWKIKSTSQEVRNKTKMPTFLPLFTTVLAPTVNQEECIGNSKTKLSLFAYFMIILHRWSKIICNKQKEGAANLEVQDPKTTYEIILFPHNSSRQKYESKEQNYAKNYKMLFKDIKEDWNKWTMCHIYGWGESISKWFQFSPIK